MRYIFSSRLLIRSSQVRWRSFYAWAEKLSGNLMADLLQILFFLIQPWDNQNDLESKCKIFSFGKIRNLEKNITLDCSRVFGKFPVFRSRLEVQNMTMNRSTGVRDLTAPNMNAILVFRWVTSSVTDIYTSKILYEMLSKLNIENN